MLPITCCSVAGVQHEDAAYSTQNTRFCWLGGAPSRAGQIAQKTEDNNPNKKRTESFILKNKKRDYKEETRNKIKAKYEFRFFLFPSENE